MWYSDVNYIGLWLEVVYKENEKFHKETITCLDLYIDYDSEEEMVEIMNKLGESLSKKYNVAFYFPSPDNWQRDCPDWWEQSTNPVCTDCSIPLIPTKSEFLPKEICYPCHRIRERNARIQNEVPHNGGVSVLLHKNNKYQRVGYATNFEDLIIAPFIKNKIIENNSEEAIKIVTLDRDDIIRLKNEVEYKIEEGILVYVAPIISAPTSKMDTTKTIVYKNTSYTLNGITEHHHILSRLIPVFNTAEKALNEGFECQIYFKQDITYRDESMLRFVNYVHKGETDIKSINKRYENIISHENVKTTLSKLVKIGCLIVNKNRVVITPKGVNLVC